MLNDVQIKDLEWKLSDIAKDYEDCDNRETEIRLRAYAQGMAYVLAKVGYLVEWDGNKAKVVKDDGRE